MSFSMSSSQSLCDELLRIWQYQQPGAALLIPPPEYWNVPSVPPVPQIYKPTSVFYNWDGIYDISPPTINPALLPGPYIPSRNDNHEAAVQAPAEDDETWPRLPGPHFGGKHLPGTCPRSRAITSDDDTDGLITPPSVAAALVDHDDSPGSAHAGPSQTNNHAQDDQSYDADSEDDEVDAENNHPVAASSSPEDPNDSDYEPEVRTVRNSKPRREGNTAPQTSVPSGFDDRPESPLSPAPTDVLEELNGDANSVNNNAGSGTDAPSMVSAPKPNEGQVPINRAINSSPARAANTSSPGGPQSNEARREGERLATDLNQLQVRSPPLQPEQSTSINPSAANGASTQSHPTMPLDIPRRQESTNSSSTEGSQGHPYPPSSLSDYTEEGYLKSMVRDAQEQQIDPVTTAAAQSAVSAADAAIMAMNGTSFVHTAAFAQPSGSGPFDLPGGYAGFTHPYNRNGTGTPRPGPIHPSRQASNSTTSASTSSEEEDLSKPTMERPNALELAPRGDKFPGYDYINYAPRHIPQVASRVPQESTIVSRNSLPNSINVNGGYTPEPAALPLGATAHSPRGLSNSESLGIANNESSEDEDDDGETVAGESSRSRSTSSGIQEPAPVSKGKGKRKAETAAPAAARGKSTVKASVAGRASDKPDGRPNKRRRSEVSHSQIDPSLYADVDDVKMENVEDSSDEASDDEDAYNSEESDYGGAGPSKSKAKPKRVTSGRTRPTISKPMKKTKPSKAPSRPSGGDITRCHYVQPYPPFTKCKETFTRKYDLPRHMDRHANEERDAVASGKVSMDKATLYASIKDRPVIQCPKCHETFTRQDALKRHCKNQNH